METLREEQAKFYRTMGDNIQRSLDDVQKSIDLLLDAQQTIAASSSPAGTTHLTTPLSASQIPQRHPTPWRSSRAPLSKRLTA